MMSRHRRKKPMGTFSIWHWLIVIVVVMLLFGGRGKISSVMGDLAHGIRNFKDGLKTPDEQRSIPDKSETAEIKKTDEVRRS
jgi:sec-independent protein translocase protein TatA